MYNRKYEQLMSSCRTGNTRMTGKTRISREANQIRLTDKGRAGALTPAQWCRHRKDSCPLEQSALGMQSWPGMEGLQCRPMSPSQAWRRGRSGPFVGSFCPFMGSLSVSQFIDLTPRQSIDRAQVNVTCRYLRVLVQDQHPIPDSRGFS